MRRFIQFNDETIDSFLFMELTDLAKTLSKNGEMELEYGPHSYMDIQDEKVYVTHFWDHRSKQEELHGLKSDIFLRTIGNLHHTDVAETRRFIENVKGTKLPSLGKQLFVLGEDIRLEEICKRERPGTKAAFATRRNLYRQHFQSQLKVNLVKSVFTDALFNGMYIILNAQSPLEQEISINHRIDMAMPFIKHSLSKFFDAGTTKDISRICLELIDVFEDILEKDMLNEYFHLPEKVYAQDEKGITIDDLKRKDPLQNDDTLDEKSTGEEEVFEEEMRTWHRETSDKGDSFLQFEIDQGSQADLMGSGVREGEEGDQALGMVQGSSQETSNKDYSQMEAARQDRDDEKGGGELEYGKENRYAYPIFLKPDSPEYDEIKAYDVNKGLIGPYQKKLQKMIEKTLEHKKIQPRSDLHFGRLNKKLLRFLTDDNPRLFYKKQNPSTEIDAVFSLLVDCSASMYDKMEQTKLGITLFHESLKSVRVPHEVVGFWEDTNDASETRQPNYMKAALDFTSSLKPGSGPEIMGLQPEEDNRDGFAIRLMTERLLQRSEKQKFLLVFSDGEPAAFDYEQNGIVDTHEAVLQARKQGIEVINVFLSNDEITEAQRKMIENIYGKFSILVSDVEELPDVLFPLLRRLLIKSI
ncbi:VWA domain-containing protein [Bacillus salacetis]|uniref:VWA domain-containing protein n=1 Tax=Bacillus salacetis TaxID=2315464 RepID=A0A3A1R016_9BACI|nr:VWA domain-containing protein [Bacillus salacetis]RIW35043.1 VWA domain-containing protein [Bacillus salacetis]